MCAVTGTSTTATATGTVRRSEEQLFRDDGTFNTSTSDSEVANTNM